MRLFFTRCGIGRTRAWQKNFFGPFGSLSSSYFLLLCFAFSLDHPWRYGAVGVISNGLRPLRNYMSIPTISLQTTSVFTLYSWGCFSPQLSALNTSTEQVQQGFHPLVSCVDWFFCTHFTTNSVLRATADSADTVQAQIRARDYFFISQCIILTCSNLEQQVSEKWTSATLKEFNQHLVSMKHLPNIKFFNK